MMIRRALVFGLPVWVFLIAYGVLTILGNFLYLTAAGSLIETLSGDGATIHAKHDLDFWALLLLPIVLVPLAFWTGRIARPAVEACARLTPEIPPAVYLPLTIALYTYALIHLAQADALSRFVSATNAVDAVKQRLALLDAIGFMPQMVMKSLLVFLTVYGAVRTANAKGWFWIIVTATNAGALTLSLILLNMKWPAVVFVMLLSLCTFVSAKKMPVTKSAIVTAVGIAIYLFLSVVALRWFPLPKEPIPQESVAQESITQEKVVKQNQVTALVIDPDRVKPPLIKPHERPPRPSDVLIAHAPVSIDITTRAASGAFELSPRLLAIALNRMAVPASYYYDMKYFANPVCHPALRQLWPKRTLECEPSLLVYARMFPNDGFTGIGTAPAAVNLYGYALAGWPGAIVSSVLAMIVLGLFLGCRELIAVRPMFCAIFVMGAYAAYFFSQLPVEGALIYDHGILWWALMIVAWSSLHAIFRAFGAHNGSSTRRPAPTPQ